MATVLLLRHGETEWNREQRVQGWAPVPLDERGREQARAAGEHLASAYAIDSVISSDLERTRETATIAGESGLPDPVFDRNWRERGFGVLQGLSYEEAFGDRPEFDVTSGEPDTTEARPENGESLLDCQERVLEGWASVLEAVGPDGTILVVTHGGPIYVLLAHLEGIDLPTMFDRDHQANCAINEIRVETTKSSGEPDVEIVRQNDTSYRESD
ncbi:histidine phosphatase family protein [Halobacteriales archaeon QS_3_64_16]|nr:MAG: histidine phosphatase family protein [Halobacteriales archaeon QS_3_64_16]